MSLENLPNFLIIGAAKSGTTALYHLIRQHPDVFMSKVKEPGFFANDDQYEKGIDWYCHTYFRHAEGSKARGEASTRYLASNRAPHRVWEDLGPEVRLLAVLRNPVERAWSLYWHLVRDGFEELTFSEALAREQDRIRDPDLIRTGSLHFAYVTSSLYAEQIQTWLRVFPREQLLVMLHEDLEDPRAALRRVFAFLRVDPDVDIDTSGRWNESSMPRSMRLQRFLFQGQDRIAQSLKPLLPARLRALGLRASRAVTERVREKNQRPFSRPGLPSHLEARLRETFASDIEELAVLLDRDLSHWLRERQS